MTGINLQVSVLWTAPQVGSGCIMLKAMVVERNDFWFMDDGGLTYTICEDDRYSTAHSTWYLTYTTCEDDRYSEPGTWYLT